MPKSDPPPTPAYAVPVPDGKLTRAEAARRLGVSRTTLRRLEGKSLHPVEGPRGVHFFEAREVEAFEITYRALRMRSPTCARDDRDRDDGDDAAEAFALFDQGASAVDVVKALRLPPDRVASWHAAWLRMKQPARPATEGELAARAFEMFAAGKSSHQVAVELKQPAPVVLAWRRDFAALDAADHVDLPPDVLATLRVMGYRLPARHPARAIPGLIEHLIEQIELRDPDCIEARKALAESKSEGSQ